MDFGPRTASACFHANLAHEQDKRVNAKLHTQRPMPKNKTNSHSGDANRCSGIVLSMHRYPCAELLARAWVHMQLLGCAPEHPFTKT